eukprot:GGOE01013788.1.p1 GENE.GGOE01013788.1~~GGOE01013788.1.p1  ORF type:complete len:688 (-),score=214.09 GGOE01013788.1:257-2029(-)
MDGKYFGKDIFTTEGAQVVVGAAPSSHTYITTHSAPYVVRETVPSPAYVVNNTADAIRLDAADGHLDGSHRGTPIYLGEEEDLAAENARLRNLISELSDTFKNRFEELSAKRDGDYLDLLARFNDANKPSSAVGKKAEKAAAPKPSTASKLIPSSKPLAAVKLGPNQILVHVQEATGLQMQDGARPCVQLQMSGVVRGTAYHEPSKHPVWRETLVIPEKAGIAGRRMIVTVKTQFGEVGRATLELPSHAVQTDVWVPISKAGKTTGNVHLGIEAAENVTIPQQVAKPRHLSRSPPRHPKAKAPVPPPAATLVTDTDAEGAIPSLLRPQVWDLTKMDGEKFWVCLVAKDGHLVLDPAEYKKAPHLWTLSQASSEAIFHAYNSSFQTAMRRKGLNKLNSYYQREINDMKGIYLSHLDEQVGGPKAVSLRLKEEQILALEQKLREAEASRDDLAAKLVESANLLTEKTHQIQAMNKAMREEVEDISETRQYLEERRRLDDAEFLRVMHGDRNLSAQTEARLYQMDHFDPQELNPEELLAEVNALRAALQEQQYETTTLRERLEAVGNNEAVRAKVMSSPARSSPPRPSPSRHI